ncbi:MAG TPA: hypothetical protein VG992_01230 [Candidatus Saccharimonadales bacterium]|nr:hypothetical protein [Candidatus Saccharimonadales bacterium]
MKQKDIVLIVAVVILGAAIAIVISRMLFSPAQHQLQGVTAQAVTATFPTPDQRYFNSNAFDPTQVIKIGQNTNSNPFNNTSQ